MGINSALKATALIAVILSGATGTALAQGADQRFCIVPLKDGARRDGAIGEVYFLTYTEFHIAGLPAPVFKPRMGNPWTIDSQRRLVRYNGAYPQTYLDKGNWGREPWSGRAVASTYGGGVSILAPGSDHFEQVADPIVEKDRRSHGYSAPAVLPRRQLTIVLSARGDRFIVDGNSLRPWLSSEELAAHGIRGIRQIFDSPLLSATIIRDSDDALYVLTDDETWHHIGSIGKEARINRVVDAPASGAALVFGSESVLAIRKNGSRHDAPFSLEKLAGTLDVYVSEMFGQALSYRSILGFWPRVRRLTAQGYVDIPGGDLRLKSDKNVWHSVHDLAALGRTLIVGADRLYLYDGNRIEPVTGGERQRIGDFSYFSDVYDLPSIGRVLITTRSGIFELTRDSSLLARPMPFPTEGIYPKPQFADWPTAGMALVATKAGVYALDRDLNATPVPGDDRIDLFGLHFAHGEMASTGDMILTGHRGVFLAVDGRGAGAEACNHERELLAAIPDSDLCLTGIPGTEETSIGFAIGGMIEAPRQKGLLIDTNLGLFLQRDDGTFTNLQPRTGQYTRGLARLPWSDEIVTSGPDGAVVGADLSVKVFANG